MILPDELEIGHFYTVSKEVPLMPEFDPKNPLKAIKKIKQLPKGILFEIRGITMKRNSPWYRVKTNMGIGWINSIALVGTNIRKA